MGAIELLADTLPNFSDEVNEAKYIIAVDVDGDAGEAPASSQDSLPLMMTSREGRRFLCNIPQNNTVPSGEGGDKAFTTAGAEVALAAQDATPGELLDALKTLCFYRIEDWWTYELCYKQAVRQFHKEAEGEAITEYILGRYDAAASDDSLVRVDEGAVAPEQQKYVSQAYTGGARCDITGGARSAEVRYVCGLGPRDALVGLEEGATCHYTLTLATPRLCSHPAFRLQEPPVAHILCSPLDPPAQLAARAVAAAANQPGASGALDPMQQSIAPDSGFPARAALQQPSAAKMDHAGDAKGSPKPAGRGKADPAQPRQAGARRPGRRRDQDRTAAGGAGGMPHRRRPQSAGAEPVGRDAAAPRLTPSATLLVRPGGAAAPAAGPMQDRERSLIAEDSDAQDFSAGGTATGPIATEGVSLAERAPAAAAPSADAGSPMVAAPVRGPVVEVRSELVVDPAHAAESAAEDEEGRPREWAPRGGMDGEL